MFLYHQGSRWSGDGSLEKPRKNLEVLLSEDLLLDRTGHKAFLLGDEAVARGAIEAGATHATTYPGTPASEIGDTLFRLRGVSGIYFEYSINEKVAYEVALGAAVSGHRALCSMKHVGVNVASDSLMTSMYTGVTGALVLISADDPACHSSQNEQDNRYYAMLGSIPMLEPSSPREAKEMVVAAFDLSEELEIPVMVRITTRIAHMRGVVEYGPVREQARDGEFVKEPSRFVCVPGHARGRHKVLLDKMTVARARFEASPLNRVIGEGSFGIITSGAAANYVDDVLDDLGLRESVSVMKLGTTYPLPRDLMTGFVEGKTGVLVVEELEPYLEDNLKAFAYDAGLRVPVAGKGTGHFSRLGEFGPDIVREAILGIDELAETVPAAERKGGADLEAIAGPGEIAARPPILCAGCAHSAAYYAVKVATGGDAIFPSDIGCYTLGVQPPVSSTDFQVSMGAGVGTATGFATVARKPVVAFVGDSTFFHAGIPGLINAVHHKSPFTLVILDNRTTAMTGHQPHPGACALADGGGESPEFSEIDLEALVRGTGVENIKVVDPYDINTTVKAVCEAVDSDRISVVICKHPCSLMEVRARGGVARTFRIDSDKCRHCGIHGDHGGCGSVIDRRQELFRSRARLEILPADPLNRHMGGGDVPAKFEVAPCTRACPAKVCVQGYMALAGAGLYEDALNLIREQVPIPGVLGRVCHSPCENGCFRGWFEEPVSINHVKRFLSDREGEGASNEWLMERVRAAGDKGREVAIVGSGPAGLAAAYDLRLKGYGVKVFEAAERPGGMPGLVIPEHRLPSQVLDREIGILEAMGIVIETGVEVGRDVSLADLFDRGYGAVFLGIGAGKGLSMRIEGEDMEEMIDVLELLKTAKRGETRKIGPRVLVVGGGDSAIDGARTAVRLGAGEVTVLYRRSSAGMPAETVEVEAAVAEGINIEFLVQPVAAVREKGVLTVRCLRMELGDYDGSGRRRPVPIEGSEFTLTTDTLIVAVGQSVDLGGIEGDLRPVCNSNGTIRVDADTGATSVAGLFAGGDAVGGPWTVIDAIATGKVAAHGIDRFLGGADEGAPFPGRYAPAEERIRVHDVRLTPRPRNVAVSVPMASRDLASEVDTGFGADDVRQEVVRCLACGECAKCRNCIDNFLCPAIVLEDGRIRIEEAMCVGCGVCAQLCPNGAIVPAEGTG